MPRLGRIDQTVGHPDELDGRRFGLIIKSVYYHFDSGRLCCAILLRTSFVLKRDEKLGSF
jgi:hypothetical protein